MKRTRTSLWLLLMLQALPLLVIILGSSGVLDPLGQFAVQRIPLPAPGEAPGFLINSARLVTAYWFFVCLWVLTLGAVAAAIYVAFNKALTKAERLAWALGLLFGQSVTVILYCVLGLLGGRGHHQPSVA